MQQKYNKRFGHGKTWSSDLDTGFQWLKTLNTVKKISFKLRSTLSVKGFKNLNL